MDKRRASDPSLGSSGSPLLQLSGGESWGKSTITQQAGLGRAARLLGAGLGLLSHQAVDSSVHASSSNSIGIVTRVPLG